MNPLYFESPEKSIPVITELLINADWETLSRYYNLSNSGIDIKELISGDFFIRDKKPEAAHPAAFWRFKHPFSPGFKYLSDYEIKENIYKVELVIEIDQGDGMIQKGFQLFYMIKYKQGFQILPEMEF
ncbi:MAG: hypothetical protein JXB17_08105 [Bacteroidales bacterium]|nr:hypothetical protein [Bacteroidales bacterium]